MPATTIDEVIFQLDEIITAECAANSCMAYFPILYKKVTVRIKEGIGTHEFENNDRMGILDVLFANRYLEAYQQMKAGNPITQSWKNTFDAAKKGNLLIMQHLLLGINAHINLDLGIAVVDTVGEAEDLKGFEGDFNKINGILASMVAGVESKIIRVSPLFGLLHRWGKGSEDKLVTFSLNIAREGAWMFANQYHASPRKEEVLKERDAAIGCVAEKLITQKSKFLKFLVKVIYFFERKDVGAVSVIFKAE